MRVSARPNESAGALISAVALAAVGWSERTLGCISLCLPAGLLACCYWGEATRSELADYCIGPSEKAQHAQQREEVPSYFHHHAPITTTILCPVPEQAAALSRYVLPLLAAERPAQPVCSRAGVTAWAPLFETLARVASVPTARRRRRDVHSLLRRPSAPLWSTFSWADRLALVHHQH